MDKITYTPRGVCSRQIEVVLDGDIIKRVESLKEKGILPKKSIPDKYLDKARE